MPAHRVPPTWIANAPRPWVVADWCSLRSLPADNRLPGRFTIVIPDRLVVEVLGTDAPEEFLRKLDGLMTHPTSIGRILIGHYWNYIAGLETSPEHVVDSATCAIHVELSEFIAQQQRTGTRVFKLSKQWPDVSTIADRKDKFITLVRMYAAEMTRESASALDELRKGKLPELTRLIQESGDAMVNLVASGYEKYRQPMWRDILREFPDRVAAARWLRVMMWYSMRHLTAPDTGDKKVGNEYDDAHYVFLSLYTKHLWTQDPGMARAASVISGGTVSVHSKWTDIPEY